MKTKSLLLTAILSLLFVSGAWAQEKYEFALIKLREFKVVVITSTDVQTFTAMKGLDYESSLLQKVEEMNSQGWEVYNTAFATNSGSNTYYLRKKKN